MNIGILGSGTVGRELGAGLLRHGHDVMIGSRTPESEELLAWQEASGGTTGSNAEAVAHGQLVVVATQFSGAKNAIDLAGPDRFAGKVVIDVTNPLDFSGGSPPRLSVGMNDSAGESIQRWIPASRVVKALNIVNARFMVDPDFPGGPPTMFIAGNDEAARATVAGLLESLGWEVADLGPIEAARYIEGLAMCWIWYGFATNTWDHAFKLLRP